MQAPRHAIDWFEIPVRDMDRAISFYEALLATEIRRETIAGSALGVIKYHDDAVGGCLIQGDNVPAPSFDGALIYLNAGPSLDIALARAEALGGRITTPKVMLPGDMGCFAHIADSEGNRIGLHAQA
ncbi:MAG: VOC family protein [Burkholderiales bacterium]